MCGSVFIWFAATRPEASCPLPSPLVSLNQGRCAGAFAWVRTQILCLPASALIASIISRALLESPGGAFFCGAAAVLASSPCRRGPFAPLYVRYYAETARLSATPEALAGYASAAVRNRFADADQFRNSSRFSLTAQEIAHRAVGPLGLVEIGNVSRPRKLPAT